MPVKMTPREAGKWAKKRATRELKGRTFEEFCELINKGVNYGRPYEKIWTSSCGRWVIARRAGHNTWSGRGLRTYVPTEHVLFDVFAAPGERGLELFHQAAKQKFEGRIHRNDLDSMIMWAGKRIEDGRWAPRPEKKSKIVKLPVKIPVEHKLPENLPFIFKTNDVQYLSSTIDEKLEEWADLRHKPHHRKAIEALERIREHVNEVYGAVQGMVDDKNRKEV